MITLVSAMRLLRHGCVSIVMFIAVLQPVHASPPAHKKAQALYAQRPQIPEIARARHLRGDGYFQFNIRWDGRVSRVDVLRSTGHRLLEDHTVAALSKWRFR